MPKNKLYNQSYFVKRLLDAGFDVRRLHIQFENDDIRKWMIIVNSRFTEYKNNICITCFKKNSNEFSFKMQGQGERDFTLKTKSMTSIIEILKSTFDNSESVERNDNEQ